MTGLVVSGFWLAQSGGFDWEPLIPLVFIVIYALSQLIGRGGKKEKPPAERHQDAEKESRARQIREEIQRKIAERQQQAPESPRDGHEGSPARYDPTRTDRDQPRRAPAQASSRRELDSGHQREVPPPRPVREVPAAAAVSSVEEQLSEQRRRLAEARRQRAAAQRRARDIVSRRAPNPRGPTFAASHEYSWELNDMSPARYREDLIRLLSDPAGAQKAVLFREVLGPPLAYRDPTSPNERIP